MKSFLLALSFSFIATVAFGQGAMITEISYDNSYDQELPFGIDSLEYVEIYLPDPQPTDPTSWQLVSYNTTPNGSNTGVVGFKRDLTYSILNWDTPNGMYYIIEFPDSTFLTFPVGGIRDGDDAIALVENGTPNIVHQFWRYENCASMTASDGPAAGAVSNPITEDFSRTCGDPGVSLVQMNSALPTNWSIQQNGFGDWELTESSSNLPDLENDSNVPVDLLYFNARAEEENVKLTWSTAQEVSNDYFSILHSTDGRRYSEIGTVRGNGDYSAQSDYDFMVENLHSGQHYFKLRQNDFDGTFVEYRVRTVKIEGDAIQLYPSLVENEINLTNVDPGTTFQLFDMQGQLIKAGIYDSTINAVDLDSGAYVLKVNETVLRFVKY